MSKYIGDAESVVTAVTSVVSEVSDDVYATLDNPEMEQMGTMILTIGATAAMAAACVATDGVALAALGPVIEGVGIAAAEASTAPTALAGLSALATSAGTYVSSDAFVGASYDALTVLAVNSATQLTQAQVTSGVISEAPSAQASTSTVSSAHGGTMHSGFIYPTKDDIALEARKGNLAMLDGYQLNNDQSQVVGFLHGLSATETQGNRRSRSNYQLESRKADISSSAVYQAWKAYHAGTQVYIPNDAPTGLSDLLKLKRFTLPEGFPNPLTNAGFA